MALTYGFFNSVDGDRKYNADSFNSFFEGLISSNGIFENVGGRLEVMASGNGLNVTIGTGKALVKNCWVKNDSATTLTCNAAHNLLARYDTIYLERSEINRNIEIKYAVGTPASNPTKAKPIRNSTVYQLILAYIYIPANLTKITSANIEDCRYNTNLCGVISGLVKQVDTTTLYKQYEAAFKELKTELEAWQVEQKAEYEKWLNALTEKLNVNTYIEKSVENVITSSDTSYIDIPTSLNYKNGDVLQIFINGVLFVEGIDYEIRINPSTNKTSMHIFYSLTKNQIVTFNNLKSKIGYNS